VCKSNGSKRSKKRSKCGTIDRDRLFAVDERDAKEGRKKSRWEAAIGLAEVHILKNVAKKHLCSVNRGLEGIVACAELVVPF
jgi:hypothetical protein